MSSPLDEIYGIGESQKNDLKDLLGQARETSDEEAAEIPDTILQDDDDEPNSSEPLLLGSANDEYLELARWVLVGIDAGMAMGQSYLAGENYEQFKREVKKDGEETKALAKILSKRAVKVTPEGIFIITMLIIYSPRFYMANGMKAEKEKAQEAAAKKENDVRRQAAANKLRKAGIDPSTIMDV